MSPTHLAYMKPSQRMTKPYWLEGENLRRECVIVDGDAAWTFICACADGDSAQVRSMLETDRNLIHAQLWYSKPIDQALRHGHLEIVRIIHEFDLENRLAFYVNDSETYRCDRAALERRGHSHILKYLDEEYGPRLVPHALPEMEAMVKRFPGRWDKDQSVDERAILDAVTQDPRLLTATDKEGQSILHLALAHRRFALAKELVSKGAAIDGKTAEGRCLTDVAANHLPEAIPWLIDLGLQPSFHAAVSAELATTVRSMVTRDPAIVNRVDATDQSPLHLAASRRLESMVALLLELGADPNYPESNSPSGAALAVASERNEVGIMRLLLEAGANPNANVDSSGSVYMFCTHWGKQHPQEAVDLLLRHGAEPVHYDEGHEEEQENLLDFLKTATEEEILAVNEDGTCLSRIETPEQLDTYVARVGNERLLKGPWYEMCKCPNDVNLLRCAVRHGLDINQGDWLGRTPLHAAAASNELERARCLLELGAEIDCIDSHSSATPLGFAARQGHVEMVDLLLAHGARQDLPEDDALAWARPLESARNYLSNHAFRYSGRTSNQGELTGRYTKAPQEHYQTIITLLQDEQSHGSCSKNAAT